MIDRLRPLPHSDPFVDATRAYIAGVADELEAHGVPSSVVWLDMGTPRDATFVLRCRNLVWNESEVFVVGEFASGEPVRSWDAGHDGFEERLVAYRIG